MKKVFSNSAEIEKIARQNFAIPDFIMMENAAHSLADFLLNFEKLSPTASTILIICGKGNNGADGLALARLLFQKRSLFFYCVEPPASKEAVVQYQMCTRMEIPFISSQDQLFQFIKNENPAIVDCIYGTGFRGQLNPEIKQVLDAMNSSEGLHIACDIPSGFYFKADYTLTMGLLKTQLYSDQAKACCGKIIQCNIGISESLFESIQKTNVYLLEKLDMNLPYRNSPSTHKGNFGHTTVFAGEKAGASILSAYAALHFGAGLSTIKTSGIDNLSQFKISPELMISDSIPQKTNCIIAGSGLGRSEQSFSILNQILSWMQSSSNPCCVLDADIFYYSDLENLLLELNNIPNAKIILTPHPKELESLAKLINLENPQNRFEFGKNFTQQFPKTALIMKSAVTYIAFEQNIYIFNEGNPSLSKAGSGDVLAGLCGALLSQNYSLPDAAITAVCAHGYASGVDGLYNGEQSFTLSPELLISNLRKLENGR